MGSPGHSHPTRYRSKSPRKPPVSLSAQGRAWLHGALAPPFPPKRRVCLLSIAPPSDIILDVAQAADPTLRDAAVARLAKLATGAGPSAPDFASSMASSGPSAPGSSVAAGEIGTFGATQHAARATSPYQKFEAVLLQTFMQDILPKDTELFGDAASADSVRSMLAEQVANQMAASGKFGIAKSIEAHAASRSLPASPADPAPAPALAAVPDIHPTTPRPFRKV